MVKKTKLAPYILPILFSYIPMIVQAAIFGIDDRVQVYQASKAKNLSSAVAVSLLSSIRDPVEDNFFKIDRSSNLKELCSAEKFRSDESIQWACTGFLVAPDMIVTAGHCVVNRGEVKNQEDGYCPIFSWLFDYADTSTVKFNYDKVPNANLYNCKKIIYAVVDESAPFRDFAVIQLDRPVIGREPLKLAANDLIAAPTAPLSTIGSPFGTPLKYSKNARVIKNDASRQSFLTTLDVFPGNSGSPVFDAKNEVVGILIGGAPIEPTFKDSKNFCERYNRCSEGATNCSIPDKETSVIPGYQGIGSEVQRINPILEIIKIAK